MVTSLVSALAEKGVKVQLFVPEVRGNDTPMGVAASVTVHSFKTRQMVPWRGFALGLRSELEAAIRVSDVVHIHELWHFPHFAASQRARALDRPYVVSVHGALNPWALKYKAWKKWPYWYLVQRRILARASALHAVTNQEMEYIRVLGFKNPVVQIPNGVAVDESTDVPPSDYLKSLYPSVQGKRVILFMGRLHAIKGLDLLAKAFIRLTSQRDDLSLLVVGPDGGYRGRFEALLRDGGALHRAVFTGMLTGKAKRAAFSGSDFLVLPSLSEGMPVVALEAMLCGKPVIASRECGFPQIEDAGAGIVVDGGEEALCRAMARLVDSDHLIGEMGERARRLVLERFTWSHVAERMLDLYHMVADNNASRRGQRPAPCGN